MKKIKLFLYTLLVGILMSACSGGYNESTCQELVDKINSGEELTESDYSTMLSQYEAIVDELISKAKEAKDRDELTEILDSMSDKIQFSGIFESTLRSANLSDKDQERYDNITKKAEEDLNNLYQKFDSEDSGLGDFNNDSSDYESDSDESSSYEDAESAGYAEEASYADYSSGDDDEDDDNDSYSSSNSENWDALLNSYEQYVNKYISYMKKAANGDTSALSEYPSLLQKAQDYSEKIKDAQGEMSSSQWARYLRITNKMAQAAQNIR